MLTQVCQTELSVCLVQEGVLKALSILCEHHAEARGKFVERASIGQLAKELESSDVQVCNPSHSACELLLAKLRP